MRGDAAQCDHGNGAALCKLAGAENAERLAPQLAACGKDGTEYARIGAACGGAGDGVNVMRGCDYETWSVAREDACLRPVHTGADAACQFGIRRDQQNERPGPANRGELARDVRTVGCTEMAINHGCAARQPLGGGHWIGRALWIGQEKQCWNRRAARGAVEPARQRG
ncbi:hypothetical protein DSM104635_03911 [Terricaulis silvestris]|uniref:Uncharacterized protein n=1 Tax=Terricaulis silvestris TaxID=2686094 RepID=A0A6I6MUB1_9CAUL|nr:hypothetical protein DSM104635_03911 [Terricaulis silvestris]